MSKSSESNIEKVVSSYQNSLRYRNIIWGTLAVILIGTLAVYILLRVISSNPQFFNGFKVGSISDWIAYSGSIIGGSITMFALFVTLRYEDNKRVELRNENDLRFKEEKASAYLPIFEISQGRQANGEFEFFLKFVTEKPYLNFALSGQEFGDNSKISGLFSMKDIPFVSPSREYSFTMQIMRNRIPTNIVNEKFLTRLYFSYSDALNIKRYTHKIEFQLQIKYDTFNKQHQLSILNNIDNIPTYESHFYVNGEHPIAITDKEVK